MMELYIFFLTKVVNYRPLFPSFTKKYEEATLITLKNEDYLLLSYNELLITYYQWLVDILACFLTYQVFTDLYTS